MASLHLIERERNMRLLDRATQAYESGDWVFSEDTIRGLVGANVYFHLAQAAPSYFGGLITGFRPLQQRPGESQRYVILFTAQQGARGISAGTDGWGNEKKIDPE